MFYRSMVILQQVNNNLLFNIIIMYNINLSDFLAVVTGGYYTLFLRRNE